MTVAVLIAREEETSRRVHGAALCARAEGGGVLAIRVPERAREESVEETAPGEVPPAIGEAGEPARRPLPGLPSVTPEEPDGEGSQAPGFTVVRVEGPDPAAAILAAMRVGGADLLHLARGEKEGGESSVLRLIAEAPCVTLPLRPGGDEAETAERVLLPAAGARP